jgi:hypothetical protein
MLKVDRTNQTFRPLGEPSLRDAQFLERSDLQECIYNSSAEFFAEIGEDVFVVGKEVAPSSAVADRIDLLGLDAAGTAVVVELKRGTNKLHMMQAISYAGMIARWTPEDFRSLLSEEDWEELTESFLDVQTDDINRRQRLLLVAEGYDYALLSGAEWLSDIHGVDVRCATVMLATDPQTGDEYLACDSIFPPPALAEQAIARGGSSRSSGSPKWESWEEALAEVENEALVAFAEEELSDGRKDYLPRRGFRYYVSGKRRWNLHCRTRFAYVWQRGRFPDDIDFWESHLSEEAGVKPVKRGECLSFRFWTAEDLEAFREAASDELKEVDWVETGPDGSGDR